MRRFFSLFAIKIFFLATLYFTVTNNLSYDQRMIRICRTLAGAGYNVTLVGRLEKNSPELTSEPFAQKRLSCIFNTGKLFYAEYNLRLFFFLLFRKMDCICAIDLDTILPVYFVSRIRKKKRVYDAHELFCEMKEVVQRPAVYRIWKRIEKFAVPNFNFGYTVNEPIADEFNKMYGVNYEVIRSITSLKPMTGIKPGQKFFIYQGAVNEGRGFETLIPAMKLVPAPLWICGDGNFLQQAKHLVKVNGLEEKVIFKGKLLPEHLWEITQQAFAGITLFDAAGKSNYFSLANRFFDYMHAGIPQLCINYPVYEKINKEYGFALMTEDISITGLAAGLNRLLEEKSLYNQLMQNALKAREQLNWQQEEKKLLRFYKDIL